MRVLVIGGGIGGLACAQGLKRRGIEVNVVEPDRDLTQTGGYKLHLGVSAVNAMRELLPPVTFEALLSSSVGSRGFSLAVRDHRGRRLVGAKEPLDGLSVDVDRITLRHVLALGIGDRLLMGRSCQGWQIVDDIVVAELDDGTHIEADVAVIADGAGSKLAQKLAGHPTSTPCGLSGIAGRSPWERLSASTRALLTQEPMLAIGPGGTGMFASTYDPARRSTIRSNFDAVSATPVAIWGLIAVDEALPDRLNQFDQAALVDLSRRLLQRHRWSANIIELVTRSQPASVSAFRFNAADPDNLAPWRSSRITALGDAVHAMPPTGGQGAATAILDAHALTLQLEAAAIGQVTPTVAIYDYEAELRTRTASAVRDSLQPVGWIRTTANPVGSVLLRGLTPVLAAGSAAARAVTRTGVINRHS